LIDDLFKFALASRFQSATRTLQRPPGEEWEAACSSLLDQLMRLRQLSQEALPQVMRELHQRYPKAGMEEVYQASLKTLDHDLMPLLQTLGLWVSSIDQWLDEEYHQDMVLLRAAVEQRLLLLLTGTLDLKKGASPKQIVRTMDVLVGDLVAPVLTDPMGAGPAAIPMTGTLGPQGAHIVMFPANMLKLSSTSPIFSHETGHLFQAIVNGLTESLTEAITEGIAAAFKSGRLNASPIEIAKGVVVSAQEFHTTLFVDQLGEMFADLIGCLVSGPKAVAYDFTTYLIALFRGLEGLNKQSSTSTRAYLRNYSSWSTEEDEHGNTGIVIEPHPIDCVRVGSWLPLIAKAMGYPEVATEVKEIAKANSVESEMLRWLSAGDKNGFTILMPVEDWQATAEVVLEALMTTKFAALGDTTLPELVSLTPEMYNSKVAPLVDLLVAGETSVPDDGSFYAIHYVGSAATEAVGRLLTENPRMSGMEAERTVHEAARAMMLGLLPSWEEQKAGSDLYRLR
jgi:hypothetical protein